MKNKGIYCLENIWTKSVKDKLSVLPILDLLDKADVCEHVYHNCATREEVDFMLERWKVKSIQDKFPILYFAFHGVKNAICLNTKNNIYTLDELANKLENSCAGKVLFFASCDTLDIDERKIHTFLNKTGAIAAIGYKISVDWMLATAFELLVFNALQEDLFDTKGINKVKEIIENDYGNLHKMNKFRMVISKSNFPRKRKS